MAVQPTAQLKKWFSKGKYPTGEQFADAFDSFVHKSDRLGAANIDGALLDAVNAKAEQTALEAVENRVLQTETEVSALTERVEDAEEKSDKDTEQTQQIPYSNIAGNPDKGEVKGYVESGHLDYWQTSSDDSEVVIIDTTAIGSTDADPGESLVADFSEQEIMAFQQKRLSLQLATLENGVQPSGYMDKFVWVKLWVKRGDTPRLYVVPLRINSMRGLARLKEVWHHWVHFRVNMMPDGWLKVFLDDYHTAQQVSEDPEVDTTMTLSDATPVYAVADNTDNAVGIINTCSVETGQVNLQALTADKTIILVNSTDSEQAVTVHDTLGNTDTVLPISRSATAIYTSETSSWSITIEPIQDSTETDKLAARVEMLESKAVGEMKGILVFDSYISPYEYGLRVFEGDEIQGAVLMRVIETDETEEGRVRTDNLYLFRYGSYGRSITFVGGTRPELKIATALEGDYNSVLKVADYADYNGGHDFKMRIYILHQWGETGVWEPSALTEDFTANKTFPFRQGENITIAEDGTISATGEVIAKNVPTSKCYAISPGVTSLTGNGSVYMNFAEKFPAQVRDWVSVNAGNQSLDFDTGDDIYKLEGFIGITQFASTANFVITVEKYDENGSQPLATFDIGERSPSSGQNGFSVMIPGCEFQFGSAQHLKISVTSSASQSTIAFDPDSQIVITKTEAL